jgi:hypothetical protein
VLVRQRWEWWRRWWSSAVCAPFALHFRENLGFFIWWKFILVVHSTLPSLWYP